MSTSKLFPAIGFRLVFHSLMPKGVEHATIEVVFLNGVEVFHSLMPKGVEHKLEVGKKYTDGRVLHSLMPKGVEHVRKSRCDQRGGRSASFVDAERR